MNNKNILYMNFEILIWIIGIYLVGFIISVFLFKHEIGEETEDIVGRNYKKTSIDVCLKAMCWPFLFIVLALFGPFMIVTKLICRK